MKLSRRNLFKASLLAVAGVLSLRKNSYILQPVMGTEGALADAKVTRQGYVHDISQAIPTDAKSLKKYTKNVTQVKKAGGSAVPSCATCRHYKKPKDGYGTCAMVGATGKTEGKLVAQTGWCRVYTINKKMFKKP